MHTMLVKEPPTGVQGGPGALARHDQYSEGEFL